MEEENKKQSSCYLDHVIHQSCVFFIYLNFF